MIIDDNEVSMTLLQNVSLEYCVYLQALVLPYNIMTVKEK